MTTAGLRSILGWAAGFVRRHWMWGVILLLGYYLWQNIHPDIEVPPGGPPAPDFMLEQMDGKTFRLSDYRGRVVVLNVWATWCPPCRVEIPGFVELQKEFSDEEVRFVGLSVDEGGLDAVRSFTEDRELNYPQVASRRVASQAYGPGNTIPRTFVIDKRGRIRYRHTGLLLKGALEPVLRHLTRESAPSSRQVQK